MTWEEIKQSEQDMLTAQDIAPVLGAHPQWIRDAARQHPEWIGFPFAFIGTRMKIPRIGFINWMEGRKTA